MSDNLVLKVLKSQRRCESSEARVRKRNTECARGWELPGPGPVPPGRCLLLLPAVPGAEAGAGSDGGHQLQGAVCKVQGGWRERWGGRSGGVCWGWESVQPLRQQQIQVLWGPKFIQLEAFQKEKIIKNYKYKIKYKHE